MCDDTAAAFRLQENAAGRRQLLGAVAQAAVAASGLLAGSVLQLLGSCGRIHSPASILQAGFPVASGWATILAG